MSARDDEVGMLCVGTDQADSRAAVDFAKSHDCAWAIVGVHPHDAKDGVDEIGVILSENHPEVVAIGEIGLDYYYNNSPREMQINALERQLQWAIDYDLPVNFHVRNGYDDFWPIFDNFSGIRGVLHSYTDTEENAEVALNKGLYIGINGISTFTKDNAQIEMYKGLPISRVLLETDAPFLTPAPFRGKMNKPSYVKIVAEYLASLYNVPYRELATTTTDNARRLFNIN